MSRWVAVLAVVAGCVDHGPGSQGKKIEASYINEHLVSAVPDDVTHVDVQLGGNVTYVGNKVPRPTLVPGQTLRITHYWKVAQPIGEGWRVFALLRGAPGTADFMNLPATDMEIGHPVDKWKAGEIIEDIQDITLRPDWHSAKATLYVGLIQTGGHDTGDRMAASGPHVVDRAAVAREFDIDLSKAPPPLGTIYIPRADGPINIDGVAMDPGWATAVTSPEFVKAEGSCGEPIGKATAKMTWDDQYLYLFVSVVDTDIVSPYKQHDDPLYKADVVEIFIDADSNRRGYVELQVNPNNATFDSWFAQTRAQKGDEAWDSGMVTAVKLRGTAEPGDTDQGWDAEMAIPWAAVKGRDDAMAVRLPPQVGDRWRLNVVRSDITTGNTAPYSGGVTSWNRITCGDFHALDRMLTAVFADRTGSIVPAPEGAGSAAAGSGSAGSGSAAVGSGSAAAPRPPTLGTAAIAHPPAQGSAAGSGSAAAAPTMRMGTVIPPGAPGSAAPPPPHMIQVAPTAVPRAAGSGSP